MTNNAGENGLPLDESFRIKLDIAKFFKDGNKYAVDVKGLVDYIISTRATPQAGEVDREKLLEEMTNAGYYTYRMASMQDHSFKKIAEGMLSAIEREFILVKRG